MDKTHDVTRYSARGECYQYFASCFYLPETELYADNGIIDHLIEALQQIYPEVAVHARLMQESASEMREERLRIEFSQLFVGPFKLPAPPYGSVYLEPDRRIMGDTTLEVIKWYNREDLFISEDFKELPDHIAVELEFMYYIIFKEVQTYLNEKFEDAKSFHEKQHNFFNSYLYQWVPVFCSEIKENTDKNYFYYLSEALRSFINKERITLTSEAKQLLPVNWSLKQSV